MASSLEDLLAEEGFKERRSFTRSRLSFRSEAVPVIQRDSPFRNKVKTERTRSDISRYSLRGEGSGSDCNKGRRPRDYLVRREKLNGESRKETNERLEGRQEDRWLNVDSSEDYQGDEITEVGEENNREKDVFLNESHSFERRYKGHSHGSNENLPVPARRSYSDKHRNSMKQRENASDKANRASKNRKSFEYGQHQKHYDSVQTIPSPALDEVAVQAIIAILSGYVKRFLQDEEFRTALRHNCFSSLSVVELEDQNSESKVIFNLEQAIEIVEKAVGDSVSPKQLKKASLQLSLITGLSSNDLKDGFTHGVPNTLLTAYAHLYLSVIYKLQKKDRVSAKHLLQVFCDSPLQARKNLLPELWDYLFFPHLSHLKVWYNQEAASISDAPSRERKLKLLDKVYSEIMDSSTYQLAVYYKDWLTEGVEAPSFPSIQIPSLSVGNFHHEDSLVCSPEPASPRGPFSPQPMVSKKLYDAVFFRSGKAEVVEVEDNMESNNYDTCRGSSDASTINVKQTSPCYTETDKDLYQNNGEPSSKSLHDVACFLEDGSTSNAEEEWRFPGISRQLEKDIPHANNSFIEDNARRITSGDSDVLNAPVLLTSNVFMLKRLAKSAFEPRQSASKSDLTLATIPNPGADSIQDSLENTTKFRPSFEELDGSDRYSHEESPWSIIPQDFICPLTGKLFEDPVTLETGLTFERLAITEWFNQGNRSCPATGKVLDYLSVPQTNFILKRVIDSWKLENYRNILELAFLIVSKAGEHCSPARSELATFILEQLLTTLSREERVMNAKHLISLKGFSFLIERFESGDLEEKTRVAALLSCCIEAESGCRYQIAREINKKCLFELVCCKKIKSTTNVVLLLTELLCFRRRKDVPSLLSDLNNEEIGKTLHALHVYLQSSPAVQRPLVATLLLNIDLLVGPQKYNLYRQEAVDAITAALKTSLIDDGVRENCCRALLMLGGRFSLSGKLLTERWILKLAGFNNASEVNSIVKGENLDVDDTILAGDEEANEEWLRNLSALLVGSGNKLFLEAVSKCLGSGNLDLVTASLATVAWMTHALSSLTNAELQLSTFSFLISQLKKNLEYGAQVEHRVLASFSLLNFSKVSECRMLLMTIAEEIESPLRSLADATWTAKKLYGMISGTLLQ